MGSSRPLTRLYELECRSFRAWAWRAGSSVKDTLMFLKVAIRTRKEP